MPLFKKKKVLSHIQIDGINFFEFEKETSPI